MAKTPLNKHAILKKFNTAPGSCTLTDIKYVEAHFKQVFNHCDAHKAAFGHYPNEEELLSEFREVLAIKTFLEGE